jgi:plastocyanin
MADFIFPTLTTAIVGFASTAPSTGKTITATVVNSGASAYSFSGNISGSNPTFTVIKGDKVVLNVNASGHPFWIKTAADTGIGSSVTTGITNNGTQSGTITWYTAGISTGTYYYICQNHSDMKGIINILNLTSVINIETSIGGINVGDLNLSSVITGTIPGWLSGRRPVSGQVFPRGVYNK